MVNLLERGSRDYIVSSGVGAEQTVPSGTTMDFVSPDFFVVEPAPPTTVRAWDCGSFFIFAFFQKLGEPFLLPCIWTISFWRGRLPLKIQIILHERQ
jgi:hypothetical protein